MEFECWPEDSVLWTKNSSFFAEVWEQSVMSNGAKLMYFHKYWSNNLVFFSYFSNQISMTNIGMLEIHTFYGHFFFSFLD